MPSPRTNAIAGLRLGAGIAALVAPDAFAAPLGGGRGATPFVTRLFGARDVGYAALLFATPPTARRAVLGVGIATDLADAASSWAASRDPEVPRGPALAGAAIALAVAALGAKALSEHP